MSEHSHYEELTALAAGGHLSDEELSDLQRHEETCAECKDAATEFRKLVHFGLPLAQSRVRRRINMFTNRPDPGATERFIRRASLEGIAFSQDVKAHASSRNPYLRFAAAGVGMLAVLGVAFLYGSYSPDHTSLHQDEQNSAQVRQQLERLSQQNAALDATISRLEQTNAEQQRETEVLRTQVAKLTAAASHIDNDRTPADTTQVASDGVRSLEEIEAQRMVQERQLADARAELAGLKRSQASDQASIVADQIRINELSDQVKTAKANASNMQRQLATASGDVPGLMGARQLHVVDVRDSGPDGKPGKAFGRIFLTEGRSLVFYAFDLNDAARDGSKKTYQVWGQTEGRAGSVRSLGFLNVDNKAHQRWVLKSNDSATFKEINSLFVTVEPQGGAKTPSGQRLLFAYLGEANHP
jgi:hypothetical protein